MGFKKERCIGFDFLGERGGGVGNMGLGILPLAVFPRLVHV